MKTRCSSASRWVILRCPLGTPEVQAKLVLLGDSGVGKSSLALRFIKNQFVENSEPTIGGALFFAQFALLTRICWSPLTPSHNYAAFVQLRSSRKSCRCKTRPFSSRYGTQPARSVGQYGALHGAQRYFSLQERFRALAPMYYRDAAAAIVVYDTTNKESMTGAKSWVR